MGKYEAHSLTAYKLEFSYMERNNPLKDELKEKIKNGEKPKVSIGDLISTVISKSKSNTDLKFDTSAFILTELKSRSSFEDGYKYVITPDVGQANKKFKVYKKNRPEPYCYGSGSVSTYSHNIYFYEFPDSSFMICHRRGSSGCKTILSKVFNDVLREKGIKLETGLILPTKDSSLKDYNPQKLIVRRKAKPSSDVADNVSSNKRFKEAVIRETTINLKMSENALINSFIERRFSNELSKNDAFIEIKKVLGDDDYNDADILLKIGKAYRTVKWDSLEELFEGKDITEDLTNMGGDSDANISTCADVYIKEIRSAEK